MKSKLIALGAAGALMMALVPATVSAAACDPTNGVSTTCTTGVTLYVSAGTTIYAPASFYINPQNLANPGGGTAYFPGQTAVSKDMLIEWMSNEGATKDIEVALTTELTKTPDVIDAANVSLWVGPTGSLVEVGAFATTSTYLKVATPAGSDGARESTYFGLTVYVPGVPVGTYVGTLTFIAQAP